MAAQGKQSRSGLQLTNPLLASSNTGRKLTSGTLTRQSGLTGLTSTTTSLTSKTGKASSRDGTDRLRGTGTSSLLTSSSLVGSTRLASTSNRLLSSSSSLRPLSGSLPSTASTGAKTSLSSSRLAPSLTTRQGSGLGRSTNVSPSPSLQGKPSTAPSSAAKPTTGTSLLTTKRPTSSTSLSRLTTSTVSTRTATRTKPATLTSLSTKKGSTSHVLGSSRTQIGRTQTGSTSRTALLSSSGRKSLLSTKSFVPSTAAESGTKQGETPASKIEVGPPRVARPVTERSEGAPLYVLPTERLETSSEPRFVPPELDANVQTPPPPLVDVVQLKTTLINSVATSLLCSPDFHDSHNATRRSLCKLGEKLSRYDPEFVLKLALYTRCDLNIRTTANFLLALAANVHNCRPYLKKYFCASVRLPSDWIEVAEIYITFHDKAINFGSLPTALRKVMAARFPKFDSYQLGKYNKDTSKKKKKEKDGDKGKGKGGGTKGEAPPTKPSPIKPPPSPKKAQSSSSSDSDSDDSSVVADSDDEGEEELEKLSFTLKQLVRKIHISEPVEHVMCLVGKRYPEDPEAFRRSHLPGTWDQDRAGKRMKLPTPETWETQVSMKGNKAATWEQLIDHNKLPFMAMLRNLRNLIIAGISPKHHRWVTSKLNDERAVVNSRQFPFRFFSAYEVLGNLEKLAKGEITPSAPKQRRGPGKKGGKPKAAKPPPKIDISVIHNYRSALDNALKIATCYNVKPIRGSTLILCNVGQNMERPCTAARGLGKPRTVLEVGILLGLMCKYSCEECTMIIYGQNDHTEVQLIEGTILNNMEQVMTAASNRGLTGRDGEVPDAFLHNMLIDRVPVDNIVLLTDSMKLDDQQGRKVMDFLGKYRHLVNPNLLFVSVDLSGKQSGVSSTIQPQHENDIYLAGYSDQILRFIAERGDSGQLTYVENVDRVYNLKEIKVSALEPTNKQSQAPVPVSPGRIVSGSLHQKWKTVRVFISSTFRDMHGERDLLTRFVFPELRARAHAKQIQIYEIDLRWGVTEEAARSHKALEICLSEISRCQYFIGLLGQRYGWAPEEYQHPDSPEYDWLNEYPPGRSITEIEMYHAALCDPEKATGKSFFYFRDPSVLSTIPDKYKDEFASDSQETREKMENLKSKIRISGLEVYDGYPSMWLGVVEEKAMVGGLEDFGQRVLHNLWNAIQRDYPQDEVDGGDLVSQSTALHEAFLESRAASFVGRRALIKQAQDLVVEMEKGGTLLVTGKPGSGKSALMAAFAQHYMESDACNSATLVLTHFIGAAPDSTNIASILTRFCHEMKRRFRLGLEVPTDYTDLVKDWPEFLEESVTVAGKESKFLVLIDGLDLLEDKHNGRSMDWLPDTIPNGVVIALSAVDGGQCATVVRRRPASPAEVKIGAMDIWDKAEMVRQTLAKHRKKLDESAFNNQMKLLLTKKEANNPLFLHLACEELRVFGVYEEVTVFLKKLPPTIANLLQDSLSRLETEHGSDVLCTSLSLLSLVRNGLQECELSSVLSREYFKKDADTEGGLPPMVIARLLRSLQSFLQPTSQESSDILALAHRDIEKAVRSRYMRGAASEREKQLHRLLAEYFQSDADPSADGSYKGNNSRAFSELPFHLLACSNWKELEKTICNIHFVVSKCQLGLAQQLLEDYTPVSTGMPTGKAREVAKFVQQPNVQAFKAFVSRNLHVLLSNPALALQQAVNEPTDSVVAQAARDTLLENPQPLITWVNKPEDPNPCHMIISSHCGPVTCVAVSEDGAFFAAGFKNCVVKLYEMATGKEVQSFIGHAAGITGVCFVGSVNLCTASHDTTLSLWNITDGIRVATLKGHTRSVHGCASNPSGKVIASVSWDTSVKVWDGRNGKILSTLKTQGTHNTPINCVAFHPEGQLIVVGSWDTTLKIWDTFNKKRLKVLKGHKTSVQACVYAPSGRHIVSAALDGEVKIWSTKSGSAVGTITGHHAPVNSIAFTPNGQYLVTASSDNLVKVWSGTLGQRVLSVGSSDFGFAHCLSFDSLSQSVRVGYHDGHVRKFNVQTGVELFAVKPHEAPVVGVACQEDFNMSAATDGSIKLWNPTFLPNSIELVGHKADISCAVWDKHGFVSASEDFNILIWPYEPRRYSKQSKLVAQGKKATVIPVGTINSPHTAKISSLAFSPDGLKMISASHDKSLVIYDVLSWKQVKILHACHKDWINTCAFSDTNSDILITGSNDFTLKLWDLKNGSEKNTFKGHTSSINSVAVSKGCIVSAAFDGSVKVWTHKGVEITTLYCHQQRINTCLIDIPSGLASSTQWADADEEESPGSQKSKIKLEEISVITGSDDGTVGVWKPFIPNEITGLVGHSDRVLSVGTTLNNHIISSSLDGSIRLWSPHLQPVGTEITGVTMRGHTGPVTGTAVSPDGTYAVSTGRDGYFIVWEIQEGEKEETTLERLYHVRGSDKALSSVCFTHINKARAATIALGKDDGTMSIYRFTPSDYPTEDAIIAAGALMGEHPVSRLMLAPDRKNLVAGSWSNRVATIGSNKKVSSRMDAHKTWVMDLAAVEEERAFVVYSVSLDHSLYRWPLPSRQGQGGSRQPTSAGNASKFNIQIDDGKKVKGEQRKEAWPLALCEIPSEAGGGRKRLLAIGDSKGRLSLWNKETKRIEATRQLHQKAINALTAAGRNLVTGSDDGTIKVWKLEGKSASLKQIGQFHCQSCVTRLASSSQGENPLIVVGDSLGHVTLLRWHQ